MSVWIEGDWDPFLYKWEQIVNVIRQRIDDGTYPERSVISEVALMEEFNVARGTIRRTMGVVREQGLVITKAGKGSIVVPKDQRPQAE
ncbi:GntR family transcriptional regulator [Streptosporangium subroseum]|uniref:GntR family transcriptional regulator n=1 Tax=Streptosporangium subroseum TaxID=106412 RepID=UPI00343CBE9F